MKDLFRIGEVCALFHVNIRTLRYYDDINLLKPAYIEPLTGYRYYSIEQFEQLNTILYLRALDMPLQDIKKHLKERNIDKTLKIFTHQQEAIEKKISQLKQVYKKLQHRIQQINYAVGELDRLGEIQEKYIEERYMVVLKYKIHKDDNLEVPIRLLENRARIERNIFLGKVGLTLSIDHLRQRSFESYDSIFLLIDAEDVDEYLLKKQPEGLYVSICFQGAHRDAAPYYHKILDYIKLRGYEITEESLEITLIDYGLTNNPSQFVTEIQILVKKY